MKALILGAVLIAKVVVTSYRSVPEQTKPHGCEWTAIGEHVSVRGIAVSQDLLAKNGGPLHYGDLIYVEGVGFKFVNDCMNARWTNRADVWVPTYADEKKFGVRVARIWLVKEAMK